MIILILIQSQEGKKMHCICYKNRWTVTGSVPNLMTTSILKC